MDISSLNVPQLRELQQNITEELKRREAQDKVAALNELKAFAQTRGYTLEQLLEAKGKPRAAVGKVRVKYRHPQNAELTWTGRGRQPRWVGDWVAAGNALDALLV